MINGTCFIDRSACISFTLFCYFQAWLTEVKCYKVNESKCFYQTSYNVLYHYWCIDVQHYIFYYCHHYLFIVIIIIIIIIEYTNNYYYWQLVFSAFVVSISYLYYP